MPFVYGISNHTPDQLLSWLRDIQLVSLSDVSLIRFDRQITEKSVKKLKDYIVILSAKDLKRNLDIINELDKTVFVFDSPLTLSEFHGINPLDYGESEDFQEWGTDLYDYFLEMDADSSNVIHNKDATYLQTLISMMEETNSLLRPLMTFIYTLPNSTHQKPVKILVCYSLFRNANEDKLVNTVNYIESTLGLPEKKKAKLLNLVLSEEACKYKEAFKKYNSNPNTDKINKLCKAYKISPYEFRYILSVVNSSEELNGENLSRLYKKI